MFSLQRTVESHKLLNVHLEEKLPLFHVQQSVESVTACPDQLLGSVRKKTNLAAIYLKNLSMAFTESPEEGEKDEKNAHEIKNSP